MGQPLLANNAYTTLATGCTSADTTLTVASSATFPAPTTASGNWFYACLQDTLANMEIVKVTNVTGTAWTVTRAIGGTTARAFSSGAVVELRMTAETLADVTAFSLTSAVQNSTPQYLTAVTGTNTVTATLPAPFTGYAAGQKFHFFAAGNNTGAMTVNVNGAGPKAVTKQGSTALTGGEVTTGAGYIIMYDGTQFQLTGGVGGSSGATGGGSDKVFVETNQNVTANYTLTAGFNAMSAGPVTVANGVVVTVPDGATWTVV